MRHLLGVATTLACMSAVRAATFVVPLTTALGSYPPSPHSFSFDLGTSLISVQSVKVEWEGNITGGYTDAPKDGRLVLWLERFKASGRSPLAGASSWPQPEAFSALTDVSPRLGFDWGFLLDGAATGSIEIDYIVGDPEPFRQASAQLTLANLRIEATPTPEPTTAILFATAGLLGSRATLRRRR